MAGPYDATAQLVIRARAGDANAFEQLVHHHLGAAHATALAILRRPEDAEEATQDAFLTALQKLDDCRDVARFSGWLLQIVRNRARNLREARAIRSAAGERQAALEPFASEAGPLEQLQRRQVGDQLVQALGALSEVQREVVLLHDLEGWTHAEIADALELSEGMSRQHLFQARQRLRAELGESAPSIERTAK